MVYSDRSMTSAPAGMGKFAPMALNFPASTRITMAGGGGTGIGIDEPAGADREDLRGHQTARC